MKTEVVFVRGPLHRIKADMDWIPQLNICIDERDRKIHAYIREELIYYYDQELSDRMTAMYDIVREKWQGRPNPIFPTGEA